MKIAICDDIKEFRQSIKCYANEYFKMKHIENFIDEFASGLALLNCKTSYDIIFLDIELGDSNGIDIAKQIQQKNKNTIILIVTSYRQYLDEAMDLNVLRYIDKPITQERIYSALDKAVFVLNNNTFVVHTKNNKILTLKKSDVIYVEAKLKRTVIVTNDETITTRENISAIRPLLNASYFAVPHSSYIVNMNYIKSFKREEIKLDLGGSEQIISVATRKQPEFKSAYINFIGEDH